VKVRDAPDARWILLVEIAQHPKSHWPAPDAMKLRLFARKTIWWPTWLGGLCVLLVVVGIGAALVSCAYPFLAVTRRVPANILVVEGWVPDYVVVEAITEFKRGNYEHLCASGGPVRKGYLLFGVTSYAGFTAATLEKLHFPKEKLLQAPAISTHRHRSYYSAKAVKDHLAERGVTVQGLNVITTGPHARRTWLVYRRVCGPQTPVGVIPYVSQEYDPARWWASSEGVKEVATEGLGWTYAWLFDEGR